MLCFMTMGIDFQLNKHFKGLLICSVHKIICANFLLSLFLTVLLSSSQTKTHGI